MPKQLGEAHKAQRKPGDSAKNECSKMSWKGKGYK